VRTKRLFGRRQVVCHPSVLAEARLRREAQRRGLDAGELLSRMVDLIDRDELYAAILDDGKPD
jgi:hypothetical protein